MRRDESSQGYRCDSYRAVRDGFFSYSFVQVYLCVYGLTGLHAWHLGGGQGRRRLLNYCISGAVRARRKIRTEIAEIGLDREERLVLPFFCVL